MSKTINQMNSVNVELAVSVRAMPQSTSAMKLAIKQAVKQRFDQNSMKYPKNNSFCYRWRVVDDFNRSIDRDLHNMRVYGGDFHQSLVNEKVLSGLKTAKLKTQSEFMKSIMADAKAFMEERKIKQSEALKLENAFTNSMQEVLKGMFDILISCSIEFNSVLGFGELFLAATEPDTMKTTNSTTTSFRANISTSRFSLVIHGFKNEIKFFVMPVEELMGLNSFNIKSEPVLCLTSQLEEEGVIWYIEDNLLTEDIAEQTCLRALQHLIEQTEIAVSNSSDY